MTEGEGEVETFFGYKFVGSFRIFGLPALEVENLWRAVAIRSGNLHFASVRKPSSQAAGACSCVKMEFISDLTFYIFTPEQLPSSPGQLLYKAAAVVGVGAGAGEALSSR